MSALASAGPLLRNGYALVLSSGATSVLGVLFWIAAARLYPAADVGIGSALIAATALLGTIAQLNLASALNRFLPTAGVSAGRFVRAAYAASAAAAVVAGVVFLLGLEVWAPTLGGVLGDPLLAAWFVLATVLWCVFVLQDGALTGLRAATWVPTENVAYAVAKLALLPVLAVAGASAALFLAWTLPLLPVVVVVNVLLARRLLRRAATVPGGVARRDVVRFVSGDYPAALLSTGVSNLLPLLVLERAGAEATAYFGLAWTIAYSLDLVGRGMGMSLVTEGARDLARLGELSWRAVRHVLALLVPGVAVLWLGAPFLLAVFGPGYEAGATTLLRVLALATLPTVVISIAMSVFRVQRRMGALLALVASVAALALPSTVLLLDALGLVGIGVAWLGTQTLVAVVLLLGVLGPLWSGHVGTRTLRRAAGLAGALRAPARRRGAGEAVAGVLAALPDAPPGGWAVSAVLPTVGDVTVATVGPRGREATAVLKVARSARGAAAVGARSDAVARLRADERLGDWAMLVPAVLAAGPRPALPPRTTFWPTRSSLSAGASAVAAGDGSAWPWTLEQRMAGVPADVVLGDARRREDAVAAVLAVIGELHRRTGVAAVVGEELLAAWVTAPLARLATLGVDAAGLAAIEAELVAALHGRVLTVAWVHGDLSPGNVLLDPAGGTVTALLDWEAASPHGLPALDGCLLRLTAAMMAEGRELGEVVCRLLEGGDAAAGGGDGPGAVGPEELPWRSVVLLTWLHHVAANVAKSARFARGGLWARRNVDPVVAAVVRGAPVAAQ